MFVTATCRRQTLVAWGQRIPARCETRDLPPGRRSISRGRYAAHHPRCSRCSPTSNTLSQSSGTLRFGWSHRRPGQRQSTRWHGWVKLAPGGWLHVESVVPTPCTPPATGTSPAARTTSSPPPRRRASSPPWCYAVARDHHHRQCLEPGHRPLRHPEQDKRRPRRLTIRRGGQADARGETHAAL
jgi:hypothetical protein